MKKFLRDLFVIILGIFIGGWTFLISTEYLNEYYQTWILQYLAAWPRVLNTCLSCSACWLATFASVFRLISMSMARLGTKTG